MADECNHIWNAHGQCQWCHRMRKDIEYDEMKVEIEILRRKIEALSECPNPQDIDEKAQCYIIEAAQYLAPKGLRDMIDYLNTLQESRHD